MAYAELVVCSMWSIPSLSAIFVELSWKFFLTFVHLALVFCQVTNHNHRSNIVRLFDLLHSHTNVNFSVGFTLGGSETQILRTRTYRKHSEIISSHYWPLTELKSNIINHLSGDLKFMTWRVGDWPYPPY